MDFNQDYLKSTEKLKRDVIIITCEKFRLKSPIVLKPRILFHGLAEIEGHRISQLKKI